MHALDIYDLVVVIMTSFSSVEQCVHQFKCDLCDTDSIACTTRHLHQRIEEQRSLAVTENSDRLVMD